MSGRILVGMSRRFGAIVLALMVVGAPAALTACEIVCATRDSATPSATGHSCHRTEPSGTPLVSGGMHLCGHDEELPAAGAHTTPPHVAVAEVKPFIVVSPDEDAVHRLRASASSPPGHRTQFIPLRI